MTDKPIIDQITDRLLGVKPAYWYMNFYRCDQCDIEWDDQWDCMCNDRCPGCHAETEPFDSIELGEVNEQ